MNVISARADLFTGSRLPKIIIPRRDGLPTASRQRRRPEGPKTCGCERLGTGAARGGVATQASCSAGVRVLGQAAGGVLDTFFGRIPS
jgi:hypothetical protein